MVFSDLDFVLVFLPATIAAFWLLRYLRWEKHSIWLLLVASGVFYAAWSMSFLLLVIASVTFNYWLARLGLTCGVPHHRIIAVGVSANLLLLAFFKYSNFLVVSAQSVTGYDFAAIASVTAMIVLPLGISFFTFQQITYLVDIGELRAHSPVREPFANYALFVMLFPHLIAGPIVRYSEISPQIARLTNVEFSHLQATGFMLFAVGLAKKVLIADPLSPIVALSFGDGAVLTMLTAWIGLFAYTFQLYFDFSGYSDMAMGIAAMFGIVFPRNFDRPYLSTSIREFWQRWHITLSRFLRDYLYIPMGGGRGRTIDIASRLLVTMLLGGLWHGAGWNFVIWGGYHGILLVTARIWSRVGFKLPLAVAWALTTMSVMLGWVWFRSTSFPNAIAYFQALGGLGTTEIASSPVKDLPAAFWIAPLLILFWNERLPVEGRFAWVGAIASGLLVFLAVTSGGEISEFLYFQF